MRVELNTSSTTYDILSRFIVAQTLKQNEKASSDVL